MIHHITGKSVTKLNQKEADVDHENKVGEAAESYVMVQYGNLLTHYSSLGTLQTFYMRG